MKKIDLGQAKKDALGVLDKTKSAIAKAADQNNDEKFGLLDKYGKTIKQLGEIEPQTLYEEYKLIKVSKKNNRDDREQYEY